MDLKNILDDYHRKSLIFIDVINSVKDNTIWGIQEVSEDIWEHFNGKWMAIKPYLIDMSLSFDYIYPNIYINLTKESKEILSMLLTEFPVSINYFWHSIFFTNDGISAEIVEGCVAMYVSRNLNIDISANTDWVDYLD
jgi:hypothetical protein